MRYLGIDYGAKRIGLALSDEDGEMAFPHRTVGDVNGIMAVVRREGVGGIVIGLPLSATGKETLATQAVRRFAARLKKTLESSRRLEHPIASLVFENELLTTKIAERHSSGDKANAAAAALILQSYLDRKRLILKAS